jgi:hypothetical protein
MGGLVSLWTERRGGRGLRDRREDKHFVELVDCRGEFLLDVADAGGLLASSH